MTESPIDSDRVPSLAICDATGRLIRRLAGAGSITWDGRDAAGQKLPAGVYMVRLVGAGDGTSILVALSR